MSLIWFMSWYYCNWPTPGRPHECKWTMSCFSDQRLPVRSSTTWIQSSARVHSPGSSLDFSCYSTNTDLSSGLESVPPTGKKNNSNYICIVRICMLVVSSPATIVFQIAILLVIKLLKVWQCHFACCRNVSVKFATFGVDLFFKSEISQTLSESVQLNQLLSLHTQYVGTVYAKKVYPHPQVLSLPYMISGAHFQM